MNTKLTTLSNNITIETYYKNKKVIMDNIYFNNSFLEKGTPNLTVMYNAKGIVKNITFAFYNNKYGEVYREITFEQGKKVADIYELCDNLINYHPITTYEVDNNLNLNKKVKTRDINKLKTLYVIALEKKIEPKIAEIEELLIPEIMLDNI